VPEPVVNNVLALLVGNNDVNLPLKTIAGVMTMITQTKISFRNPPKIAIKA